MVATTVQRASNQQMGNSFLHTGHSKNMATSYNSPTPQERWHQFSAAAVRAFHRYATWLVKLSWWRFGWYALLLIIATLILAGERRGRRWPLSSTRSSRPGESV